MRGRSVPSSNARLLIVEGTAGIGKTTLLTKLLRRYAASRGRGRCCT
jgi:flagellar biosynthesis GTPase FlhF